MTHRCPLTCRNLPETVGRSNGGVPDIRTLGIRDTNGVRRYSLAAEMKPTAGLVLHYNANSGPGSRVRECRNYGYPVFSIQRLPPGFFMNEGRWRAATAP